MLTTTTSEFLQHLADCLDLDDSAVPRPGRWFEAGNTIGMLALRLNLLSVDQIERIVDAQPASPTEETVDTSLLFGQIAVQLGYLNNPQVERLLEIQRLNRQLELGQHLVAEGRIDVPTLVRFVDQFVNA